MSLINSFDSGFNRKKQTIQLKTPPVVFLSFDEPNADDNYNHLKNNHPFLNFSSTTITIISTSCPAIRSIFLVCHAEPVEVQTKKDVTSIGARVGFLVSSGKRAVVR